MGRNGGRNERCVLTVTLGTCGTFPAWSGAAGAADATQKENYFMSTNNNEIVEGLLKWWGARFGIVAGSRNANLYKLAAALNNYGIPQGEALEVCLQYVDPTGADPLTAQEITVTVASAYRRTEHGVKQWTRGTWRRSTPPPPVRRRLTAAQAQAVEDRLVESLLQHFQLVPVAQGIPDPTPSAPSAPVTTPAMVLTEAEIVMQRLTERNPAIHALIKELDLALSTAKLTKS